MELSEHPLLEHEPTEHSPAYGATEPVPLPGGGADLDLIETMAEHGLAACFEDGFATVWKPGHAAIVFRVDVYEAQGRPVLAMRRAIRSAARACLQQLASPAG